MSESPAPDEIQDTPDDQPAPELESEETTQTDTATEPETPDFFDEKFDPASLPDELRPAYKQMRGAFTQKTQTLAEERQEIEQSKQILEYLTSDDPSEQAIALQALGYDLSGDEEDDTEYADEEDNELSQLREQLTALNEWKETQEQSSQAQQFESAMNEFLDEQREELQSKTGREFTEEEWEVLEDLAVSPRYHDDGLPSLEKAYERIYGDLFGGERKKWLGKKRPQPAPGDGSAGTQQVDHSDDNARIAAMARAIEAGGD